MKAEASFIPFLSQIVYSRSCRFLPDCRIECCIPLCAIHADITTFSRILPGRMGLVPSVLQRSLAPYSNFISGLIPLCSSIYFLFCTVLLVYSKVASVSLCAGLVPVPFGTACAVLHTLTRMPVVVCEVFG